jgi:acetyl-CoA carboxylase biotin carboxyl carrier protein
MDLTSADVQDILQLIDSMQVRELHLQTTRFALSLCRGEDGEWTQELQVLSEPNVLPQQAGPAPLPHAGPAAKQPPAGSGPTAQHDAARAVAAQGVIPGASALVRAPLLGTFYRAPRPGAPPFVEVGSQVEPDTVIGIIETMKLMNSVSAGLRGRVTEILVADAQFAPQGAPLMRVAIADDDPLAGAGR